MKATGIVRRVDELGRIVIPKEMRRVFEIVENETALEIFVEDGKIVLKTYKPGCIFCGEASEIVNYKGKNICKKCIKDIS